ncbi:MAG TPA: hypothetical protein VFH08_19450 [Chitinophagaceae bacterium]|nr:hypothetical protein [Chitinophagaceae bacterium]
MDEGMVVEKMGHPVKLNVLSTPCMLSQIMSIHFKLLCPSIALVLAFLVATARTDDKIKLPCRKPVMIDRKWSDNEWSNAIKIAASESLTINLKQTF